MEITQGSLLGGRVRHAQPRAGHRTSLEPVLLAAADQPPLYDAEGHTRAVGGGRMLGSA